MNTTTTADTHFKRLSERLHAVLSHSLRKKWPDAKGHIVHVNPDCVAVYLFVPQQNGDSTQQANQLAELTELVKMVLDKAKLLAFHRYLQSKMLDERISHLSFWLPLSEADAALQSAD